MEVHPRVSTFIYQEDMILPYLAIKLALGEISGEDLNKYTSKIQHGRTTLRYYNQMFLNEVSNV